MKGHKTNLKLKRPAKRKAVSEVISSLLLVVITVVGALILTQFLDETFVAGSSSVTGANNNLKVLKLWAYDTRDSTELLRIDTLDNNIGDGVLVGDSVAVSADLIPSNGGTEFMVLQIENQGLDPVFVEDVVINGVRHDWDSDTPDTAINASADVTLGEYPRAGMFSLADIETNIQFANAEISEGEQVNLIVKLSDEVTDIPLNNSIRVLLNIGFSQPIEFIIEGGSAR